MATHRGRKSRFDSIHPAVLRPQLASVRSSTHPQPPDHLEAPEQKIWERVVRDFQLPAIAIDILTVALEGHQRARQCRQVVDRDGLCVTGRDNQVRSHPLLSVERDARAAFLAGIKQLGLDTVRDGPSYPSPWADAS
jgi:P27 family predicted phage terminase small subunit